MDVWSIRLFCGYSDQKDRGTLPYMAFLGMSGLFMDALTEGVWSIFRASLDLDMVGSLSVLKDGYLLAIKISI